MTGVQVRATHPFGFRSGHWADVVGVAWQSFRDRACYRVRFPDGQEDLWPIVDPMDSYEFRAAPEAPAPRPASELRESVLGLARHVLDPFGSGETVVVALRDVVDLLDRRAALAVPKEETP